MKKIMIITAVLGLMGWKVAMANPLPMYMIDYVNAFPPQVRFISHGFLTALGGDTIFTTSGIAIIDSGVFVGDLPLILDSTNTSGFVINSEADSISTNLTWYEPVLWGTMGRNAPPIYGHSIYLAVYSHNYFVDHVFTFDFAVPRMGFTQVVINEINSHCNWAPNCNYIELYNKSDATINLSDWMVVCDQVYRIPYGALIPGHGYYVVDQSEFPSLFDMDFDSDNIYLVNADSQVVDEVGWYSDHGANVSFMRYPDGDADTLNYMTDFQGYNDATSTTFENGWPSRGAANRHDSPGFRIFGIHADTSGCLANICWTNPIWDPTFSEAILRRSATGFPSTPAEGDSVYEGIHQQYYGDLLTPGVRYYYTVFARTSSGDYTIPDSESQISVLVPLQGISDDQVPGKAALIECYPNPFNATTLIRYRLISSQAARMEIYNLGGQKVATLFDNLQDAGEHSVIWDGSGFSSGVYFAKLSTQSGQNIAKMTLIK